MAAQLIDALHAVKDEHTFRLFLFALAEDRKEPNPISPWQWDKIEDFLEAAAAWSDTSKNGLPRYQPPENAWKRCADIMFSGKIYE
jgi:hypothetical protein